ncbi:MAG: restriction endonuclease subunit S, partial [Acidobacteria bacterium]|nr:restriction endonuclease subunit S [Acidobacteriota bacterium]
QPLLTHSILKNIKIPVVRDPRNQEAIASMLSAYDDLIENNRRRIQLLEQSARLLYKEWFIHLRFPGHEHVNITDGIPEGWVYPQVKDLIGQIKRPMKIKKSDYLEKGTYPCVDQSTSFIGGYTEESHAIIDIGTPVIVFGDHTRILKYVDFPFASGADGTQLLISKQKDITQEYLYFALDGIDLSNYFYARHFKFLKDQQVPYPSKELVRHFTDFARPVMNQVKTLRDICRKLVSARDLLLPRLFNGDISP